MKPAMQQRGLGKTGIMVSPIGLGTVKIGRNTGVKYPRAFDLPGDDAVMALLDAAKACGVNLLDTAPAYGSSEKRLGELLARRGDRDEWVLSTKAGEVYSDGESSFDFSPGAIAASCERSLQRLGTDRVECLMLHSDGEAELTFEGSGAFDALDELKARGLVRATGASVKTEAGAAAAVRRCDAVMIEFSLAEPGMGPAVDAAGGAGVGVLLKKVLGSGRVGEGFGVTAEEALGFVLKRPAVTSVVVGTLNPAHLAANVAAAESALRG